MTTRAAFGRLRRPSARRALRTRAFALALTALAAASLAAPHAEAQRAAPDYVIGPNDVLSVYVWGHPEISTSVSVSASGGISYPLIGDVAVGGSSVRDAEDRIRQALSKYYVDPKVTVTLAGLVGKTISVTGEVEKPGDYNYVEGFTISQYVAKAGGAKDAANVNKTRITRLGESGAKVITIDLDEVAKRGRRDLDLVLEPGDNVTVPRKFLSAFRDYATIAQLLLSAVTVYTLIELRTNR